MLMQTPELIIRPGTVADLDAVHALVHELARYERAADEVSATPDTYRRDLESGWFELLVAEHYGEIIGIALGHRAYSTWKGRIYYLDDLVVGESWRGRGVGLRLFEAFAGMARLRGAVLLKWQVLDWNEPALRFYRRLSARIETDWLNGKLPL
jgi:GNAT superfamily N-acetyltransferase